MKKEEINKIHKILFGLVFLFLLPIIIIFPISQMLNRIPNQWILFFLMISFLLLNIILIIYSVKWKEYNFKVLLKTLFANPINKNTWILGIYFLGSMIVICVFAIVLLILPIPENYLFIFLFNIPFSLGLIFMNVWVIIAEFNEKTSLDLNIHLNDINKENFYHFFNKFDNVKKTDLILLKKNNNIWFFWNIFFTFIWTITSGVLSFISSFSPNSLANFILLFLSIAVYPFIIVMININFSYREKHKNYDWNKDIKWLIKHVCYIDCNNNYLSDKNIFIHDLHPKSLIEQYKILLLISLLYKDIKQHKIITILCSQNEHETRYEKHIGEYIKNKIEYNEKINNFIKEAKKNISKNKLIDKINSNYKNQIVEKIYNFEKFFTLKFVCSNIYKQK